MGQLPLDKPRLPMLAANLLSHDHCAIRARHIHGHQPTEEPRPDGIPKLLARFHGCGGDRADYALHAGRLPWEHRSQAGAVDEGVAAMGDKRFLDGSRVRRVAGDEGQSRRDGRTDHFLELALVAHVDHDLVFVCEESGQ